MKFSTVFLLAAAGLAAAVAVPASEQAETRLEARGGEFDNMGAWTDDNYKATLDDDDFFNEEAIPKSKRKGTEESGDAAAGTGTGGASGGQTERKIKKAKGPSQKTGSQS